MIIAVALILVVVGSLAFHFLSPWWMTPIASNWTFIDGTIIVTFIITGVVFSAVVLFVAYCAFRFRHRDGVRADYEPENRRLEGILTAVTAVGVIALLMPGLFVWAQFINVPQDAPEAEVVGSQWQWAYRLPGADGKLGRTDVALISDDNSFGINTTDPAGNDDVLIEGDYLHLPLDKPVKLVLRSTDTLHDFYVPEFRAKMDMIPGSVTYVWLTPTRTGQFDVLCAELCGLGHPYMRGGVVVDTDADYQAWLAQQPTFTQLEPPKAASLQN